MRHPLELGSKGTKKEREEYYRDVKKNRKKQHLSLMFYGASIYNHKVPCHVYPRETPEEKDATKMALKKENADHAAHFDLTQTRAHPALCGMLFKAF
jgi:hypothetical protein